MTYKVILIFLNGREETLSIPGKEEKDGTVYMPSGIGYDNKYFELNTKEKKDGYFKYEETERPFRMDLH